MTQILPIKFQEHLQVKKAADFCHKSLLKTAAGRSPTLLAISAPYTTG
jgi:hypothetical protein